MHEVVSKVFVGIFDLPLGFNELLDELFVCRRKCRRVNMLKRECSLDLWFVRWRMLTRYFRRRKSYWDCNWRRGVGKRMREGYEQEYEE